jgi:hypothetical protein
LDQVTILKKGRLIYLAAIQTAAIFTSQILEDDAFRGDVNARMKTRNLAIGYHHATLWVPAYQDSSIQRPA